MQPQPQPQPDPPSAARPRKRQNSGPPWAGTVVSDQQDADEESPLVPLRAVSTSSPATPTSPTPPTADAAVQTTSSPPWLETLAAGLRPATRAEWWHALLQPRQSPDPAIMRTAPSADPMAAPDRNEAIPMGDNVDAHNNNDGTSVADPDK